VTINIYIKQCMEYTHSSVNIPEGLSQSEFEDECIGAEDPYSEGDVFSILPYIGSSSRITISVSDKEVAEYTSFDGFNQKTVNEINFQPPQSKEPGEAKLLWGHDMKYSTDFVWNSVLEFDKAKLCFLFGKDQLGGIYLEGLKYDNQSPDDIDEYIDPGAGYTDIQFFYHPNQAWED